MKNVSFCVQGPVAFGPDGDNHTLKLVESIRRFFPDSPIIFSTWHGEPTENFRGCEMVLTPDPDSGLRLVGSNQENNINRQILSTRAGLDAVTTEWAVKLRSDLLFHSNVLARILARLPFTAPGPLSFFKRYVLVLDRLTFDPGKKPNPSLHVTDMFQAGLACDLRMFWDQPLMSASDEIWFAEDPTRSGGYLPRFRAEQYFWKNLVSSKTLFEFDSSEVREEELPWKTVDTFQNNLIPFKFPTLGLSLQKAEYHWTWKDSWISSTYAYSYLDWARQNKALHRSLGLSVRTLYWEVRGEVMRRLKSKIWFSSRAVAL